MKEINDMMAYKRRDKDDRLDEKRKGRLKKNKKRNTMNSIQMKIKKGK